MMQTSFLRKSVDSIISWSELYESSGIKESIKAHIESCWPEDPTSIQPLVNKDLDWCCAGGVGVSGVQEEPGLDPKELAIGEYTSAAPLMQVLLPLCLVAQMKNTCDLIPNGMCTLHKEQCGLQPTDTQPAVCYGWMNYWVSPSKAPYWPSHRPTGENSNSVAQFGFTHRRLSQESSWFFDLDDDNQFSV